MNINDAKRVINALEQKPFVYSNNCIETDNGYVIITKEHYAKCKSAQEKQTPKKPIETSIAKLKFPGISFCPTCDNAVINDEADDYKQAYCCYCGQALDWNEAKQPPPTE